VPFKRIPLRKLQKYKKWVTTDFDIPDFLAVTFTPFRPPARIGRGQRMVGKVVHGGVIIYTVTIFTMPFP